MLVEACVDSVASAAAAAAGGAGRVELCANLPEGGTTPGPGTIALARERLGIPLFVLVRPRAGDFLYDADDAETMCRDLAFARAAGAAVHGPAPQGPFLAALGLFQRTDRLARTQPPLRAAALVQAAQRLAEPDRMGRLFKAVALCHPALSTPPGFEA